MAAVRSGAGAWYDLERFERLVAAMIHADRRLGRVRTVRELVADFRGLTGTAKQKAILAELGLARASLEDLVGDDGALDHDRLERLLGAMRRRARRPRPQRSGIIGKDHLLARLPLGEVGQRASTTASGSTTTRCRRGSPRSPSPSTRTARTAGCCSAG